MNNNLYAFIYNVFKGFGLRINGGRGEIRTHGGREPTSVFKTGALNRSATLPETEFYHNVNTLNKIYSTNISSWKPKSFIFSIRVGYKIPKR